MSVLAAFLFLMIKTHPESDKHLKGLDNVGFQRSYLLAYLSGLVDVLRSILTNAVNVYQVYRSTSVELSPSANRRRDSLQIRER